MPLWRLHKAAGAFPDERWRTDSFLHSLMAAPQIFRMLASDLLRSSDIGLLSPAFGLCAITTAVTAVTDFDDDFENNRLFQLILDDIG